MEWLGCFLEGNRTPFGNILLRNNAEPPTVPYRAAERVSLAVPVSRFGSNKYYLFFMHVMLFEE
jgi:hypothetical protein